MSTRAIKTPIGPLTLVACGGAYATLWRAQQELESLGAKGAVT